MLSPLAMLPATSRTMSKVMSRPHMP
jgi:hypothetical protein